MTDLERAARQVLEIFDYGILREEQDRRVAALRHALEADEQPCPCCGDGNGRLVVIRVCDTCGSEYAGQAELDKAKRMAAAELRRLHTENQQLVELALEEAKINGAGAERELKLMTDLENKQAELLRIKAHAEMQRMDDEALLRRALEALQYAYENLPLIHATEMDPIIVKLKNRRDEGR